MVKLFVGIFFLTVIACEVLISASISNNFLEISFNYSGSKICIYTLDHQVMSINCLYVNDKSQRKITCINFSLICIEYRTNVPSGNFAVRINSRRLFKSIPFANLISSLFNFDSKGSITLSN